MQDLVNILPFLIPSECDELEKKRASVCGLHLGSPRITKNSNRMATTKNFPEDAQFATVHTKTGDNTDRTKRRIQHATIAELEHMTFFKEYLLNNPAAKLIRIKVFNFAESTLESRIQIHPLEDLWNEHGVVETFTLAAVQFI